jgi:hypothetical protein
MRVVVRMLAALSTVALGALALPACGPSFQLIYEGDARFEHCYAVDEAATVSMQEKSECWEEWLHNHAYGQTRDRIDYAAMRAKALREAPATPTDEAVMSAAPGGGSTRPGTQENPVTTSAWTTPPKTIGEAERTPDGGTSSKGRADRGKHQANTALVAPPAPAPAEACTEACRTAWRACQSDCDPKRCADCGAIYGRCMKACF